MITKYYNLMPVEGLFVGLNHRAIEHLLVFGDWLDIKKMNIRQPDTFCSLLFTGEEDDSSSFNLNGCILGNKIIPAYVHAIDNDLPLYSYKMVNYDLDRDAMWYHEMLDNKKSLLYKDITLLCLSSDLESKLYEWSQKEVELMEILIESE